MTSFVFRETLMSHLLIWGNAYAQIIRNGAGRVLGLYPLLPDKMDVQRDDRGNIYYVYSRNSDENPMFKEYGDIRLKAEDVLHIPGLGFDGLIGYSPIAMAKNAVGMTLACEEYGASFFANGANPGGVLEHPGVLKDPSKVRESWNSVYRGVSNAHKIAVLEEGMKYQQIGIPPEEAQFLETRKFQINEIARLYRIPPHMVGDLDKSSFSNIEQQSLEFVKYTLDPWVIRFNIEQYISREFGRRIGTKEEEAFFIGDGKGKPTGIFNATGGAETGVTSTGTSITFDDVMDLYYSLRAPYRNKAVWLLNDSTVKAIRKLKDGNGNYIWQPSVREGEPDKILNRPYRTSIYVPELAAGNRVMAFGDYSYYWIADRQGRSFKRLNELYATTGQVGFLASERVDGKLILSEAVKTLDIKAAGK